MTAETNRRALRTLGYALLVLALPLAVWGAAHQPNEYRATLGIDALDCDGPIHTYILAVPPLLLYAVAALIHARRPRRRTRLAVAAACVLICAALLANIARATLHERAQADACAAH